MHAGQELILMAPCNERFCIGLFWMYEQDRIGEIGKEQTLRDDGRRGDGSRRFYNRTSAVVARATGVTG